MSRRREDARSYKHYSERRLQSCLSDIENKLLTQREASERYKIPRSSIILKLKAIRNNSIRPPGRQCIFTMEEESAFVDHAIQMCRYGFPITLFDLRCIVKMYLDKKGRTVSAFSNNLPGRTWAQLFLKRHRSELSQRFSSNIKRVRAAVDENTITSYFNHLKAEIEGIPPNLIYNYDETNLVDDPGKKKILTKRGTKYPEAIKNSTKAAFSLMMCGNAAGELLPPYVNYKADNLWDTWTEGGPPNTRYNRSKSGWFDGNSFEDWFFTTVLPALRREEGKKLIIGDNLSSHLSYEVIKACEENNIAFVALPPNSTHLTQPLDVAFFRPLKLHWRNILDQWKSTREGQVLPTIPKQRFPSLLKELWENIAPRTEDNLKAGFMKTGIFPTDEQPVLQRLPTFKHPEASVDPEIVGESFIEYLENKRKEVVGQGKGGRKKKLKIDPGKSISSEELKRAQEEAEPTTSKKAKKGTSKKAKKGGKKKRKNKNETDSESETDIDEQAVETVDTSDSEGPFVEEDEEGIQSVGRSSPPSALSAQYKLEDYVVVEYEGELWPGQIISIEDEGAYVKCMARSGLCWKWPDREDKFFYRISDIKFTINEPQKKSTKRALFQVPELADRWGFQKNNFFWVDLSLFFLF